MNAELILAIAAVVGVGGSFIGLGVTWRRNGREQRSRDDIRAQRESDAASAQKDRDIKNAEATATRDAIITSNQKAILERLNDPQTGMQAMNQTVNDMITHCAEVSTGVIGRVTTTERDIKELKSKKK